MTTTALAVELIIIGYQTLLWLVLALSLSPSFAGLQLATVREWKELLLVGSLVAAYTSGAIVNGLTSKLMESYEKKRVFKRTRPPSEMRAAILIHQPEALKQVMTYFDVPRVLRSTIFNIPLIAVFAVARFWRVLSCYEVLILVVGFVFVLYGAVRAWYETDENYYTHLCQTYDALKGTKSDSANDGVQPIAEKIGSG